MSAISVTRLYELLVPKLGKEATEYLITFNETTIKTQLENNIKHLATKDDINHAITAINEKLARIDERFAKIDERFARIDERFTRIDERFTRIDEKFTGLDEKFLGLDQKMDAKISKSQSETIKWMFVFWLGQVIATTASLLLFFKK